MRLRLRRFPSSAFPLKRDSCEIVPEAAVAFAVTAALGAVAFVVESVIAALDPVGFVAPVIETIDSVVAFVAAAAAEAMRKIAA